MSDLKNPSGKNLGGLTSEEIEAGRQRAREAMGRAKDLDKKTESVLVEKPIDFEKRQIEAALAMEGEERKNKRVKQELEEKDISAMRQKIDEEVKKLKEEEIIRKQEEEKAKLKEQEAEERAKQEKFQKIEESKRLVEDLKQGSGNHIELLRTFGEDATLAMQTENTGVDGATMTDSAQMLGGPTGSGSKLKTLFFLVLLILLTGTMGYGLWYWQTNRSTTVTVEKRPITILDYSELATVNLDKIGEEGFQSWLANYLQAATQIKQGQNSIIYLYPTKEFHNDSQNPKAVSLAPADLPYLIDKLSLPFPDQLKFYFEPEGFMFGLNRSAQSSNLFLIIKIKSYERTVSGLINNEVILAGMFAGLTGANNATGTVTFNDKLINNIPVRSATNNSNQKSLVYGFVDNNRTLLLLTDSEQSFGSIISAYMTPRLPGAD